MVKITTWKVCEKAYPWIKLDKQLDFLSSIALHMHVCCLVISLRLSFEHPLHLPQIGRAFEAPIGYKPYWVATCCSSTLLLPIFLERTIAEGKVFWKIWGFERGLSYLSQLVFIWVLLELGLDWEKSSQRKEDNYSWKGIERRDQTHPLQRLVSTSGGDADAKERPDDEQCSTRVRWKLESASGLSELDNRIDRT